MNLPNVLTVLRIFMVPVFAYLYHCEATGWALAVFLLAGLTDALDGYLARRLRQITSFGKLMDPLADKLMTLTMLICLAVSGRIEKWVPIAMMFKEACMVGASTFLLRKRNVVAHANLFGKTATVLFIVAIAAVYPWHNIDWLYQAGRILIYCAFAASFVAGIQYGVLYARRLFTKKEL